MTSSSNLEHRGRGTVTIGATINKVIIDINITHEPADSTRNLEHRDRGTVTIGATINKVIIDINITQEPADSTRNLDPLALRLGELENF